MWLLLCFFFLFFSFFFTVRIVLFAHLTHLVGCSSEKHEKCRQFKVTRSPRALTIFIWYENANRMQSNALPKYCLSFSLSPEWQNFYVSFVWDASLWVKYDTNINKMIISSRFERISFLSISRGHDFPHQNFRYPLLNSKNWLKKLASIASRDVIGFSTRAA